MTRNEILQATHASFSEFQHISLGHRRAHGIGALVFLPEEEPGNGELRCEYWTVRELLHYLRRMQGDVEIFYRCLEIAAHEGGCPIVILPPGSQRESEQLQISGAGVGAAIYSPPRATML